MLKTDESVAQKAQRALSAGVTPIVCVGETLAQREAGQTEEVVKRQLAAVVHLNGHCISEIALAYEPVWAIGTGKVASAQVAQDMHHTIRHQLAEFNEDVATHIGILYGGSVKPDNAVELFAMPDIDGGLVGGASLNASDFLAICRA